MNDKDIHYLEVIGENCEKISEAVNRFGKSYETFRDDNVYYDSVLMNIFQIGELVNKLSDSAHTVLDEYIEGYKIVAVRNRIAHAYDDVDRSVIWDIVINHIPLLKTFCTKHVVQNAHLLSPIDIDLIRANTSDM